MSKSTASLSRAANAATVLSASYLARLNRRSTIRGQGVHMSAVAKLLEGREIARGIEAFSRRSVAHGGHRWASEDVRPGAGLCLYRATADSHWILAKDGRPDHRIPVLRT